MHYAKGDNMTTISVTYTDDEVDKFKRTLFADEAWSVMHKLDGLVRQQLKHGEEKNSLPRCKPCLKPSKPWLANISMNP